MRIMDIFDGIGRFGAVLCGRVYLNGAGRTRTADARFRKQKTYSTGSTGCLVISNIPYSLGVGGFLLDGESIFKVSLEALSSCAISLLISSFPTVILLYIGTYQWSVPIEN